MKIKYIHFTEPEKEKVCDSVALNERDTNFRRAFFSGPWDPMRPQEKYDKYLLEKMEKDKEMGYILSYQVMS